MNFWTSISGMLEIKITSADPGQMLQAINQLGIPLFCISCPEELTVEMRILRSDLLPIQAECKKRGYTLKICRTLGLYWSVLGLLRRPVLVVGFVCLLFLILYLPSRVVLALRQS